jgi:hypothetical protein
MQRATTAAKRSEHFIGLGGTECGAKLNSKHHKFKARLPPENTIYKNKKSLSFDKLSFLSRR